MGGAHNSSVPLGMEDDARGSARKRRQVMELYHGVTVAVGAGKHLTIYAGKWNREAAVIAGSEMVLTRCTHGRMSPQRNTNAKSSRLRSHTAYIRSADTACAITYRPQDKGIGWNDVLVMLTKVKKASISYTQDRV